MELCMTQARKFAAGSQRWQDLLCVRKGDAAISPRKTRRTQLVAPPVAQVVTPTVTQAPDLASVSTTLPVPCGIPDMVRHTDMIPSSHNFPHFILVHSLFLGFF